MTDAEKREAARQFHNKWVGKGKEDEDDRSYWIDFLQDVMGVDHVTDRIEFQKKVVGPDGNTKRIDAYIPETHVLIEQKSLNIDLSKPQPGHNNMTPYEQAKCMIIRYRLVKRQNGLFYRTLLKYGFMTWIQECRSLLSLRWMIFHQNIACLIS